MNCQESRGLRSSRHCPPQDMCSDSKAGAEYSRTWIWLRLSGNHNTSSDQSRHGFPASYLLFEIYIVQILTRWPSNLLIQHETSYQRANRPVNCDSGWRIYSWDFAESHYNRDDSGRIRCQVWLPTKVTCSWSVSSCHQASRPWSALKWRATYREQEWYLRKPRSLPDITTIAPDRD